MMWFNKSVTTESEKNINNLFFKITQLRFFCIKEQPRATAAASVQKVDHQNRTGNGRLIKLLNDYQSIILLRLYQLHLGRYYHLISQMCIATGCPQTAERQSTFKHRY